MNTSTPPPRLLLIEDEPDLRAGLVHNLTLDGYDVEVAEDGRVGLQMAQASTYSLILLDLMLPHLSGIDLLRRLRADGRNTPVIILSAKGQDHDKVTGLELGADDYVTKPFGIAELTARIRAVLRRTSPLATASGNGHRDVWVFPHLVVDFKRFVVQRDGREFPLSRFEAEVLRLLLAHRGQVVTRGDLLTKVWGYVHLPTTRTVDNHIARLRKKVEHDVDNPTYVVTVHGIGYRFDPEPLEVRT
ncbi:MAG: response regulator transcription factor [Planctomycetota bacterium]